MATVSEVKWIKTGKGICPDCGQEQVDLGILNLENMDVPKCIDCYFGSPPELREIEDSRVEDLGPYQYSSMKAPIYNGL